jgi:protein-L-isoaspartate(D-aspartate) O-methyltransferase
MTGERASLDEIRGFFAKRMAAASKSEDPRLERIFELVPREAFLGPGPWRIWVAERRYLETPSADPAYLYQNDLVALDAAKGINNGEPLLHAAWIGAVAPQRGESVTHVGAGTGYYTAILSMLTLPHGSVSAFELDTQLAEKARQNLEPFEGVSVVNADATQTRLPKSDVIYVNAGVSAPPADWLQALKPGGRLIFPWRPTEHIGLAMIVRAHLDHFSVTPLMPAWFIPCVGASKEIAAIRTPRSRAETWSIRSIWTTAARPPGDSAIAIYPDVWFSNEAPGLG